jgi:hypothetical protein
MTIIFYQKKRGERPNLLMVELVKNLTCSASFLTITQSRNFSQLFELANAASKVSFVHANGRKNYFIAVQKACELASSEL